MTACAGYDIGASSACGRQDAREVVAGCLHEHIGPRDLCPWHADDLTAGFMRCGECHEAGCSCVLALLKGGDDMDFMDPSIYYYG